MYEEEVKRQLLSSAEESYEDDSLESYQDNHCESIQKHSTKRVIKLLAYPLFFSLVCNVVLLTAYFRARSQIYLCPSEYSGLGLTTKSTYWQSTQYTDPDRNISDAAWEAIDTTPNTISLDKEYATKHELPDSIPFPWDQSKGLYIVKAFHHMHCLKNIRHAYNELLVSHPGEKQLIDQHHIYHCLDILRQDIMCRPDDTPMPTTQERHKIGDGQERKCKDWNALIAWTQNAEREACFRMFSDYRRMHTLEQFAFCNEESKYRRTMVEYFEKHGHKPMFLDEDNGMKGSEIY